MLLLFLIHIFSACGTDTLAPKLPLEDEENFRDESGKSFVLPGSVKDPIAGEPVVPKDFGYLYGFVDMEGRVAIPAQYTYAEQMREGLAYVEKEDEKFIINNTGRVVLKIDNDLNGNPFYQMYGYYNGAAILDYGVSSSSLASRYVDREGNDITGKIYSWARSFSEGLAYVEEADNNKGGYIDKKGGYVLEIDIENFRGRNFYDGRACICAKNDGDGDYGYINEKGDWIVPPKFPEARDFFDGVARVSYGAFPWLWGYIDQNGDWLLEPQYKTATDFVEGKAVVNRNTVIDKFGKVFAKAPEDMNLSGPFSEGLAAARMADDENLLIGYVDENFNWVIPPLYEGELYPNLCKNGLILIEGERDGFAHYFNRDGKLLAKNPVRKH